MSYEGQYNDAMLEGMQSAYGKGFLSPGGAEEVGDIVAGLDLAGREVLDFGCGVGGAVVLLATEHGAASVVGLDVENVLLDLAAANVAAAGLADRVTLTLAEPGPLPLPEGRFDVVFSKDVFCHLPDKAPFYAEVFRVLRPGGVLAFGDWIKPWEGPMTAAFDDWATRLRAGGLKFYFETLEDYMGGLEAAGFEAVEARDHSAKAARKARREYEHAIGPGREELGRLVGEDRVEARIHLTRARMEALAGGGLHHYHLQARRPA